MARELKTAQALPDKKHHDLKELSVGEKVFVQNQYGNKPKKWHNTGRVVQTLPYRRYMILMDGSRRVTMRNRRFLRRAPEPVASNLPNIVVPREVHPLKVVSDDSQPSAQEETVEPSFVRVDPFRSGKVPKRRFVTSTPTKPSSPLTATEPLHQSTSPPPTTAEPSDQPTNPPPTNAEPSNQSPTTEVTQPATQSSWEPTTLDALPQPRYGSRIRSAPKRLINEWNKYYK